MRDQMSMDDFTGACEMNSNSYPSKYNGLKQDFKISEETTIKEDYEYENWAKTFTCHPELYIEPTTVDDLIAIYKLAKSNGKKIRFVGNGRSPSDLPCTSDYMISMRKFNRILKIDIPAMTVTAEGGILLSDLLKNLHSHGYTLPCLPTISDITLAGAVSTGTHGTGITRGILSSYIKEMSILKADGTIVTVNHQTDCDVLKAVSISLGLFGAILSLTIDIQKDFNLRCSSKNNTLTGTLSTFKVNMETYEYYRFMYYPGINVCTEYKTEKTCSPVDNKPCWVKNVLFEYYILGILFILSNFLPTIASIIHKLSSYIRGAVYTTIVDKSHKILNFDIYFAQYVSEWSCPVDSLPKVLMDLEEAAIDSKVTVNGPVEVRFVKSDELYISQTSNVDSAFLNIISYCPWGFKCHKSQWWSTFEQVMRKYNGRPHWAKLHTVTPKEFKQQFGKNWDKYEKIRKRFDPDRLFANSYIDRHLFGSGKMDVSFEP